MKVNFTEGPNDFSSRVNPSAPQVFSIHPSTPGGTHYLFTFVSMNADAC